MNTFLNRFNLAFIIGTYSALALSLYTQLTIYILIFGGACASWRLAHYCGRISLMRPLLLNVVVITSSLACVLLVYPQGLFTILLHLIFLGFSLKFLELSAVRDVYFFVNTGFVLIALFFIFNTSVGSTFIALLLVLLLLGVLLSLDVPHWVKKDFAGLLIKSCLLSLPLALLLFVIMPRLPSLWKMPIQKQATTGLSDRVSPGEIAALSRSSALAFRATFKGPAAPANERYWRAMTLDDFDGKTWTQSAALKKQESNAKRGIGRGVNLRTPETQIRREYELIMEPHYNFWLPVLDYALTSKGLVSLSDHSLRSNKPIVTRRAFTVLQISKMEADTLTLSEHQQLTQLPLEGNPETDRWINDNLQKGQSKENILQQLLRRFNTDFRYTLQPGKLGENQVDEFLFTTQSGFCVHYASSYLYVARRLGFPARMVTGYLGGEWQASEGFFSVRQYDAHAWVEIWRDDRWQRVDPTSYVAPERVELGLEASLTDANEFLADEYFSLQKWKSIAFLNAIRARLANIDYLWARYVVNFNHRKQQQLMQRWLAQVPWLSIGYGLLIMMATIFVLLLGVIFKPWHKVKVAPEDVIYRALQKYFAKKSLLRETGHTISEYCVLLSHQSSLDKTTLAGFSECYNQLKYQPHLSKVQRLQLLKELKTLKNKLIKSECITS